MLPARGLVGLGLDVFVVASVCQGCVLICCSEGFGMVCGSFVIWTMCRVDII